MNGLRFRIGAGKPPVPANEFSRRIRVHQREEGEPEVERLELEFFRLEVLHEQTPGRSSVTIAAAQFADRPRPKSPPFEIF
jgi:hypothetical protein